MAKKPKFYAIREGHKTGIVTTWAECQAYTDGYSNAVFKSFSTQEEAEQYMNIQKACIKPEDLMENSVQIYSDGSFDKNTQIFSYGYVALDNNNNILYESNGYCGGDSSISTHSRNIAGELMGVVQATDWAISKGYKQLILYYDYKGIECWATDEWQANLELTRAYKDIMKLLQTKIEIFFVKVQAHSNNTFNDMADKLAKEGLTSPKKIPSTYFLEILMKYKHGDKFTHFKR